ncbi:helix-turn-helix domain-containing protein [Streptomyces sp. SID486]|uniref:helix-turn-helix domain-containing protein n=1 Tax=Streptomyces sp. SID486 TaxID=2690264 RepID=UPI00136D97FD|nr:helix-turn-helix domain-containing protein [Streptomyces sp. SID486]
MRGADAGRLPLPRPALAGAPVPALSRPFLPAQVRAAARFTGPDRVRTLGLLRVSTYRGAARSFVGSDEDTTDPHLTLGVHSSGRATLVRQNGTAACGPDDIFVCDGADPFVLHESEDFELHLVRVPRLALALTDRQVRTLGARTPFADGPVAPLLGPFLRQFLGGLPTCPPSTALRGAATIAGFVDSLAVADERTTGDELSPEQERLMQRIRVYVDTRLWDRNLTPATVAEAQHISVRYLHKLFEGQGSTVGRWIQHRRLEEARRELARPGTGDIAVSAVARRWGFANATHFSRSFRTAYGMSPSDWRSRTRPARDTGREHD